MFKNRYKVYYVGYNGLHATCNQELSGNEEEERKSCNIYFLMRFLFFHKHFYYVFGRDYFEN